MPLSANIEIVYIMYTHETLGTEVFVYLTLLYSPKSLPATASK
jgi:hypothetical protein